MTDTAIPRTMSRSSARALCHAVSASAARPDIVVADAGQLLTGHTGSGAPVAPWRQPLPGAGAIQSGLTGLSQWLTENLNPSEPLRAEAIAAATTPRAAIDQTRSIGLGWLVDERGVVSHAGETAGFSAALVLDRASGRGAAILADETSLSQAMLDMLAGVVAGGEETMTDAAPIGDEWTVRAEAVITSLIDERAGDVWD